MLVYVLDKKIYIVKLAKICKRVLGKPGSDLSFNTTASDLGVPAEYLYVPFEWEIHNRYRETYTHLYYIFISDL